MQQPLKFKDRAFGVPQGRLVLEARDAQTHELVDFRDGGNVVVLSAKEALINAVKSTSSDYLIHKLVTGNDITDGGRAAYQIVDFGGSVTGGGATGLANDATVYSTDTYINNVLTTVNVTGSNAQTFTALINEINTDLTGKGASVAISGGNIQLTADSTDPEQIVNFDNATDTLFSACTGFVAFNAAINEGNPETPKDTYDLNTMPNNSTVFYDSTSYAHPPNLIFGNNSVTEIIVNHTITGATVLGDLGLLSTDTVKFTSAALHTGNGKVFAYKRFARLSLSNNINVHVVWYISYP